MNIDWLRRPKAYRLIWMAVLLCVAGCLFVTYEANKCLPSHASPPVVSSTGHSSTSAEPCVFNKRLAGPIAIGAALGLGLVCFGSFWVASRQTPEPSSLWPWAFWLATAAVFGAVTIEYHPAIAFLACVAAFVAIEHLQQLLTTGRSVSRVEHSSAQLVETVDTLKAAGLDLAIQVNQLVNRHGVSTFQRHLHSYYLDNYAVRGVLFFWDWQAHLDDDLHLLDNIERALKTYDPDDVSGQSRITLNNALGALLSESAHLSRFGPVNREPGSVPEYATSCWVIRLIDLIRCAHAQKFEPIQLFAAAPILVKNDIRYSLPLHNYRSLSSIQCFANYLGCCAQALFVYRFHQVLQLAIKRSLISGPPSGEHMGMNESRIRFGLASSPPWHYAASIFVDGSGRRIKKGVVAQLFRGRHETDVAIDITAEENPASLAFVPSAMTTDSGIEPASETLARYDDHLKRLEYESVPLEPYLVSLALYYQLRESAGKSIPGSGDGVISVTERIADLGLSEIPYSEGWSQKPYGQACHTFYCRQMLSRFLDSQGAVGTRRVRGKTDALPLLRRVL
jgi:hypothetical protein